MQHIVIVTTSYPDGVPGSEAAGSFVEDFASEMSKHCAVTVVAPGIQAVSKAHGNPRIVRFPVPKLPLSNLDILKPGDAYAIYETLRTGGKSLSAVLDNGNVDHIFALWVFPSGFWARSAGRKYHVPYSTWALGSDIWSLGRIPLVHHLLRKTLRDASLNYADGFGLCEAVRRLGSTDCSFLPSTRAFPADADHLPAEKPPYRLAFLGRWHTNKGADLLLRSLALLSDQDWARIAGVEIHGGGPLEDAVRTHVQTLRSAGRPIAVGGYLDKRAASRLIGTVDYLLLPSRIESIPVIFSDAMKSGTPVIATPAGDLPSLLARYRAGVLATSATSESYAASIREALETPASSFLPGIREARTAFNLGAIVERLLVDIRKGTASND